jgi:hypothetical protein
MDAAPQGLAPRLSALCLEVDGASDRSALDRLLIDLRVSNKDRAAILHLVRTFTREPLQDEATLRRFLHRVGRQMVPAALELRRADALAVGQPDDSAALSARAGAVLVSGAPLALGELAVTGNDLMTELGVPPGRGLGALLGRLLEHCLEHPEDNERQRLLGVARALSPAT